METVAPLRDRWQQRWEQSREWLSLGPIFIPVGDRLFEKYSEAGRHYHDARHILACLKTLDTYPGRVGNANALELAIWYHDVIYDPRANDNEAQSAAFFRREFQAFASGVDKVERLILATRHGVVEPETADEALLIDIDLGVLGAEAPRYQGYAEEIRREYAHVPDRQYREGRSRVLKSFLGRKHIYQTRHFRRLLEERARENLVRELDLLVGN